ncbi:hypothetical protein D3C73_1341980 [compost metagenome]
MANARLGVTKAVGSRCRGLAMPLVCGRSGRIHAQNLAIGPTVGSRIRQRAVL